MVLGTYINTTHLISNYFIIDTKILFSVELYSECCFRVLYSLLLNEKGGVEADVTVTILDGGSGQLHEPIFKVTFI